MWSDSKQKSSTTAAPKKSNLRVVPKTKWELPKQKPKSYWKNVLEDLDARHTKVNEPSFSLFPQSLIIPPESSVSIHDKPLTKPETPNVKTIMIMNEPIVKISPPSPSHNGNKRLGFKKSPITDSLEYLKSHDLSNFNLDIAQQKKQPDEQQSYENVADVRDNKQSTPQVKTPLNLPAIGQISQLTKISRYVNDFLASTKVKVKASISPKNYVHPQRELIRETTTRQGHCIIGGTLIDINNQTHQEESTPVADQIPVDEPQSIEIHQKHVVIKEPEEGNVKTIDNSYGLISRPRAPSLGVASLVPSFGRMISSLEYSDSVGSRSSIESPLDDVNTTQGASPRYSPALYQFQQNPDMKCKIFLETPTVSPRRTIVHTIRALKTMKAGTISSEKSHHKQVTPGSSPSLIQGHSFVGKSSSSSIEKSTAASENSTSSDHSTEQTVLKNRAKFISDARVKAVPLTQKPSFRLEDLPPMGGMYQRKKRNKCLACMRKLTVNLDPVFRLANQTDVMLSPYKLNIAEFDHLLATKFTERITKVRTRSEFIDDKVSPLPEEHKHSGKSNHQFDHLDNFENRPMRVNHLEKKFTQRESSIRENLISAKSFVSTLSLTSEQSRTISEQEDSDHGLEPVAEAGEELIGAGSKCRAPCHAPLNLRPSLEPLMALKGKKSKSIQSRSASLEKSMDEGSDGADDDDDDDEIEEATPKVKGQEVTKVSSLKLTDGPSLDAIAESEKKESVASVQDEIRADKLSGDVSLSDAIYHQINVQIRTTDHNPSHSFYPILPVMSDAEIMVIARRSLDADKSIKDILLSLLEQYLHRLSMKTGNKTSIGDYNFQKISQITNHLLALLIDSKLYLNPELTSSNLQFSSKQKPYCNSQQLRRFLPFKSYNLVAPILGMPEWHPKRWSALKSARSLKASFKSKRVVTVVEDLSSVSVISTKTESGDDFDLIVHPPSPRESLDNVPDGPKQKKMNPYASFLSKPRRKVVIWRPLTERDLEGYDPESTLKNRAAKVTDKICKDFCDWLRSLGGSHATIDEEILKDMFETDFTAEACRTMRGNSPPFATLLIDFKQVCVKEMPMVPTVVAAMRHCPESGEPEVTRRQLIRDVGAERKPAKIVGFGSTVPNRLRYEPPRNNVHDKWIHCSSVPQELESMSFVWKDITHLDSVRGFSHWLKRHSHMKLPKALDKIKKNHPSIKI